MNECGGILAWVGLTDTYGAEIQDILYSRRYLRIRMDKDGQASNTNVCDWKFRDPHDIVGFALYMAEEGGEAMMTGTFQCDVTVCGGGKTSVYKPPWWKFWAKEVFVTYPCPDTLEISPGALVINIDDMGSP